MSGIAARIAEVRRKQSKALLGGSSSAARPSAPTIEPDLGFAPSEAISAGAPSPSVAHGHPELRRDHLIREFEALLPAAQNLYGYATEDVDHLRAFLVAQGEASLGELQRTIRQWRIDAVAHGLDRVGVLGDGVSARARLQFRKDILGLDKDESGAPISEESLHWQPEARGVPLELVVPCAADGPSPSSAAKSAAYPPTSKPRRSPRP